MRISIAAVVVVAFAAASAAASPVHAAAAEDNSAKARRLFQAGSKAYAGEQHVRRAGEYVGLGVMGTGGLFAAAAGLWFLFLVLREMRGWWAARGTAPGLSLQSTP